MFAARLKQLKEQIKKEKLDAVFISSYASISYLSGYSNFSKEEREAYIFIGNNFAYIITDGRYSEAISREVPHLELFQRGNRNQEENLLKKHKGEIKKLGIEEDSLTVSEHKILKKHFKNLRHFNVLRSIKEKKEIEKIKKAAKLGDKTFKFILKKIKQGITEKQLAFEIEFFIRRKALLIKDYGAEMSFPTIVAFSKNSSIPHHQTGETKLSDKRGQFVLLDFGVRWENYCSDMTRTIFFGKPNYRQKRIYETVLDAQKRAVDFINQTVKNGKEVKAKEVDRVAREYIISKGYPSIPHSLGHGVGLEIHEHPHISPKSKEELKEGMVFSIEPGIYIPGFGGVRIEDLYVLEEKGLRQITNAPKNLITI